MITAVDTCILIDILEPDPQHGPKSRDALRACMKQGAIDACDVVWAEVATVYAGSIDNLMAALDRLGIGFSPLNQQAALRAAKCWHSYRRSSGGRERIVADFLIGGHAIEQCNRLLTRDSGFYRRCFKGLEIVTP